MFDINEYFKKNNLVYTPKITILHEMKAEKHLLEVILKDGSLVFGFPDCLVPEEDDNGDTHDELVFVVYGEDYRIWLREEDVVEFRKVDEEYVEAILASQESAD